MQTSSRNAPNPEPRLSLAIFAGLGLKVDVIRRIGKDHVCWLAVQQVVEVERIQSIAAD